jgi:hypothetical protein
MITVLLWKKSSIDLFIERHDIVLSDFYPDICPWADIAMALPVATHRHNIYVITYTYVIKTIYTQIMISCVMSCISRFV